MFCKKKKKKIIAFKGRVRKKLKEKIKTIKGKEEYIKLLNEDNKRIVNNLDQSVKNMQATINQQDNSNKELKERVAELLKANEEMEKDLDKYAHIIKNQCKLMDSIKEEKGQLIKKLENCYNRIKYEFRAQI